MEIVRTIPVFSTLIIKPLRSMCSGFFFFWFEHGLGSSLKSNVGEGSGPPSTIEILPSKEGNGHTLTNDEMERMMARRAFRIEELEDWKTAQEEWRQEMEMWREQMTKHIGRVLGYLNEINGLKKAGKWPKK